MLRLCERVGTYEGYRGWQELASCARYNGKTKIEMTESELRWCANNLSNIGNTAQVRIFRGFAYIFKGDCGHAKTLVTVIPVA